MLSLVIKTEPVVTYRTIERNGWQMRPSVWPKQPANSTLTPPLLLLLLLLLLICTDVFLSLFYSFFLFYFFLPRFSAMFHFITLVTLCMPVQVVARSNAWVCNRSLAGILGSNPGQRRTFVCCECCVLSGGGLCDEMTTRAEESNWLRCVGVCDLKTLSTLRPWPALGRCAEEKKSCFSSVFDLCLILGKKSKASGMLYRFDSNVFTTILKGLSASNLNLSNPLTKEAPRFSVTPQKNLTIDTSSHPRRTAPSPKLLWKF